MKYVLPWVSLGMALLLASSGCEQADALCDGGASCGEAEEPSVDGAIDGEDIGEDCIPGPEICDGFDNDCDRAVDEDLDPLMRRCQPDDPLIATECVAGRWQDPCDGPVPEPEVCDGVDNDLDGQIDNLGSCYRGPVVTAAIGVCTRGTLTCDAETGAVACVGEVLPTAERFRNGLDDACDGRIDEEAVLVEQCVNEACDETVLINLDEADPDGQYDVITFLREPAARNLEPGEIEQRQDRIIAEVESLAELNGAPFIVTRRYGQLPGFTVEASPLALSLLSDHELVDSVMPDLLLRASLGPSGRHVGADRAHVDGLSTGSGVRVAVLDGGADYRHAAFGACAAMGAPGCKIVDGYDFVDGDQDPKDEGDGHGMAIAGAIAGLPVQQEAGGIAPDAELVVLRVIDANGAAGAGEILEAIDWLLARPQLGVDVVYIGATGISRDLRGCLDIGGAFANKLTRLSQAHAQGTLFVGPTGNGGHPARVGFPTCLPEIFGVGAAYHQNLQGRIDHEDCFDMNPGIDQVACFSNGTRNVDDMVRLVAPGVQIRAPHAFEENNGMGVPAHHFREATGTSIAAAIVAGAAAVLKAARPNEDAAAIWRRLVDHAVDIPDTDIGRLDLWASIDRQCVDADRDGVPAPGPRCIENVDCDDGDPTVNPNAEEVCDSIDNNCDGEVDEGFMVGQICTSGIGQCAVDGLFICGANGEAACDPPAGQPAVETCNDLDDDCDGQTDERLTGSPCNTGNLGVCAAGTLQCIAGQSWCQPLNAPGPFEVCNAEDDDCDGQVDEQAAQVGQVCQTGRPGQCALGQSACVGGAMQCRGPSPEAEVCNGSDEDCDGRVDEFSQGVGSPCNTGRFGLCSEGRHVCSNGRLNCQQVHEPQVEICGNGVDDDCDGRVDRLGPPEACDGIDNDCDGMIDEDSCGVLVERSCTLRLARTDNRNMGNVPRPDWGRFPGVEEYHDRNFGVGRTRGAQWLTLPMVGGDLDGSDWLGVALDCGGSQLDQWVEQHCGVYLGWCDGCDGGDQRHGAANWLGAPPALTDQAGRDKVVSTLMRSGWFSPIQFGGDVDHNDKIGVAWVCRDPVNPALADSMTRALSVGFAWCDGAHANCPGPGDVFASPPACPPNSGRGRQGEAAGCCITDGTGRFCVDRLGGDTDGNDVFYMTLRARN